MGRLVLVRHGESVGNRIRHFTTSPEAALTELGREQALSAARRVKELFNPRLVIASPYARARDTAAIIAVELGLALGINPGLHERNFGRLAGQPYEAVRKDPAFDPSRPWQWRPPGGESQEDVVRRVGPVFDRLARAYERDEIVVVSHGGVMHALWVHITGSWDDATVPPNCGIVRVDYQSGRYSAPVVIAASPNGQ
jgi:broad specificity phosphatase PhoE